MFRGHLNTLNSDFTLSAARSFPIAIQVLIVSLTLEPTNIGCFVETSSSCCDLEWRNRVTESSHSIARFETSFHWHITDASTLFSQQRLRFIHETHQVNKRVPLKKRKDHNCCLTHACFSPRSRAGTTATNHSYLLGIGECRGIGQAFFIQALPNPSIVVSHAVGALRQLFSRNLHMVSP